MSRCYLFCGTLLFCLRNYNWCVRQWVASFDGLISLSGNLPRNCCYCFFYLCWLIVENRTLFLSVFLSLHWLCVHPHCMRTLTRHTRTSVRLSGCLSVCYPLPNSSKKSRKNKNWVNVARSMSKLKVTATMLDTFFTARRSYAIAVLGVAILSVRPSDTRILCDTTKQCTADILTPHERAITLVFWHQQWLVGDAPFCLKFALKVTHPLRETSTSTDFRL